MSTAKNAILRAKLNGVITELLVKTNAANVMYDENTTLAAHLATLATSASVEQLQQAINGLGALAKKDKVSQSDLDEALATLIAGKADQTALQGEIDRAKGVEEGLAGRLDTVEGNITTMNGVIEGHTTAINTLVGSDSNKSVRTIANEEIAAQLISADAAESLNELKEIADWIQSHPGDAAAMNTAITALQNKVVLGTYVDGEETKEYATVKAYVEAAIAALNIGDYALAADLTALAGRVGTLETTAGNLKAMAFKDIVSESDLATELAEKVNAASEGNHAHLNKELLDTYDQTNADLKDAVAKKHSHDNKAVLDGIDASDITAWNRKGTVYYTSDDTAPEAMNENDLWFQIVE